MESVMQTSEIFERIPVRYNQISPTTVHQPGYEIPVPDFQRRNV